MTSAVIVSTARTPLAKSWKGAFNMTHGATLGGHAVKHAIASSSESVCGTTQSGTAVAPGRRPRSSRDRPPFCSSRDGAHHATTCDCARVSAT